MSEFAVSDLDCLAEVHLRSSQPKPKVKKVCGDSLLSGTRATVCAFPNEGEAHASFVGCFSDIFIDPRRYEHSLMLCAKLAELAADKLEGQENCFLGLGAKGIGKSQFFTALGDWFTRIGDRNCAFLYQQMGETEANSPFDVRTTNVRKIVRHIASELGWDNVPTEPWKTSTGCLDWLLCNQKKVFLVLDEFEQCYLVENRAGLLSDLAKVGGDARQRPLVIVILGSSSRLRNLCFRKGDPEEMVKAGFAGYASAVSLNSTKFVPLIFSPITTVELTKQVLFSLEINSSKDFDFVGLCKATRGEVRAFRRMSGIIMTTPSQDVSKVRRNDAWDDRSNQFILRILWQNVQRSIQDRSLNLDQLSNVMNLAVDLNQRMEQQLSCSKENFFNFGLTTGQLYQCADESVIAFDGGNVCFLHPADIECCISLFGKESRTDGRLTLAEQISLLNANNASTDEINERLVCESLCEHGITVEDLGRLTFASGSLNAPECCHGVVRHGTTLSLIAHDSCSDLLNPMYVGCHSMEAQESIQAAHLRKEYPDEIGGDLIAVFRVQQKMERVRFIVVRVQIKLGASGKTNADKDDRTPITKMRENEPFIVRALRGTANNVDVDFVRVLWTSQVTKATTDIAQRIVVIKSTDMMNYWIEPVKAFVRERRLTAYGFQITPSLPRTA